MNVLEPVAMDFNLATHPKIYELLALVTSHSNIDVSTFDAPFGYEVDADLSEYRIDVSKSADTQSHIDSLSEKAYSLGEFLVDQTFDVLFGSDQEDGIFQRLQKSLRHPLSKKDWKEKVDRELRNMLNTVIDVIPGHSFTIRQLFLATLSRFPMPMREPRPVIVHGFIDAMGDQFPDLEKSILQILSEDDAPKLYIQAPPSMYRRFLISSAYGLVTEEQFRSVELIMLGLEHFLNHHCKEVYDVPLNNAFHDVFLDFQLVIGEQSWPAFDVIAALTKFYVDAMRGGQLSGDKGNKHES